MRLVLRSKVHALLMGAAIFAGGCGGASDDCQSQCGDPAATPDASTSRDLGSGDCIACGPDGGGDNDGAAAQNGDGDLAPPIPVDLGPTPIYATMTEAAAALTPGSWYQLPAKNKLADVFAVAKPGDNWQVAGGPTSVVNAWGGGVVAQGKLFLWGGGHNDYGGNEVYTFDLGTWTFARVTDPSNYKAYPCGYTEAVGSCVTADNTPVSAHSYEGVNFIPSLGQFWVGGGAVYSTAGGFGSQSAVFDMTNKKWTMLPNMPVGGSMFSAWDPVSEKLLAIVGNGAFFAYNPATNKYENSSGPNWSVGASGDFDPDHRLFVLYDDARANQMYVYDLSGLDLKPDTSISSSRFDYKTTYKAGAPFRPKLSSATGMVYVPARKLFVLWDGQSSDVWTLDPTTWEWNQVVAKNAGPTPATMSRGVYGRWRYMPEYGVFLAYDNIDQSPWIYKLP